MLVKIVVNSTLYLVLAYKMWNNEIVTLLLACTALVQNYDLPRKGAPLTSKHIRLRISTSIHTDMLLAISFISVLSKSVDQV